MGFTDGHHCITDDDKRDAKALGASLLYGEILPAGGTPRPLGLLPPRVLPV